MTGSNTTTYAWDFENRLTSVTLPGSGGTVSFKYDPFGRRIYKSSLSGTSVFAYDRDNLAEETDSSGTVVARYLEGASIDEPLAMLRSGATSYYNADGLGSITSLTNSSGAVVRTYTYDSFGKLTASVGSLTNPFQYTGRESDSEIGLYFYRARYLDPTTGRFVSEDPLKFRSGDTDFYSYVENDPVNSADPMGLCKIIVRYTKVFRFVPVYHAYIITIDPSGLMTGMRAGPGQTGNIHADYGPYDPKFPDFEPEVAKNPEQGCHNTVLNDDQPCRHYNVLLEEALDQIELLNIPYPYAPFLPGSKNSNSAVNQALSFAHLPVPTPPVSAPGWNTPLFPFGGGGQRARWES